MSTLQRIEVMSRAVHMKRTLGLARAAKYCANQGLPLPIAVSLLARKS